MQMFDLIKKFPNEDNLTAKPRPYFNHSVEFKEVFSAEERTKMLEDVGLNVFFFPAEMITGCDMLSDSGTSTMTNEQWAALHKGDESYGSNKGYFLLAEQIRETFGDEFFNKPNEKRNAFIFHQGRPCEDAFFTTISKLGNNLIIPSNGHFDTTQANIEANGCKALNFFSSELKDENSNSNFKGNMSLTKLKELLQKDSSRIPITYLTITNNTGGGQPVSLENIRQVSELVHGYNIPLFFDACRFAENAWFIKKNEQGYGSKSIKEIIKEMFTYCDGFTISFKKDGLVNMGGGLFIKKNGLFAKKYPDVQDQIMNHQIIKEGHPTYGGLSGRDIMALSVGLKVITKEEYLNHRIGQVRDFGNEMNKKGLPVLMPAGGHAIYLDVNKFFEGTNIQPNDFGGISFTAVLLAAYGHRACELGNFAFGSVDESGNDVFPEVNFVRFAIPRLRYEKQDLDFVVESVKALHENKENILPVDVIYGKELPLRHFKAKFRFRTT